jgi:hypothetical protein
MTTERRRPRQKPSVTEPVPAPAPEAPASEAPAPEEVTAAQEVPPQAAEVPPPALEAPPPAVSPPAPEALPPADVPQPIAAMVWRPVPGSITAAAVLLLVMATLTGLFGTIMLLTGLLSTLPTMVWEPGFEGFSRMAQVFMVGFAVILLLLATAHLAAGVGLLRRRGWARILGLVLAVLGLLIFALGVAGSAVALVQPWPLALSGTIVGLVLTAIIGVFYAFVLIVLMRRGDVFA